jgi:hypothetical protein
MKIVKKLKLFAIIWLSVFTICCALVIFGIWDSEPREWVKSDKLASDMLPSARWILTIGFVSVWAFFSRIAFKIIKFLIQLEKNIPEIKEKLKIK